MKNMTPLILIIVSVGMFFFFIDPKYQDIKTLQAEIQENNKIVDIAKQLTNRKTQVENQYNQISSAEKSDLEKLLPDAIDNVRLILDINNIAETTGVLIKDMDIKTQQEPTASNTLISSEGFDSSIFSTNDSALQYVDSTKIGVMSFSFSATAQYSNFIEFLSQLERSKRIMDIRSIEIMRETNESGTTFFDYKVTFDTYWLK
jgi:Tfp pilus assembly protein PilO